MMIRWWSDDNQMMIKTLLQNCYHLHLHWWVGNQILCCLILKRDIFCWSWIYWPNINTLPSNSRHKSRNFDISSDDDIFPKIDMRRKSTLIIVNFESLRGAPKSAVLCILPTDSHQFLNIQGWKSSSALKNIISLLFDHVARLTRKGRQRRTIRFRGNNLQEGFNFFISLLAAM